LTSITPFGSHPKTLDLKATSAKFHHLNFNKESYKLLVKDTVNFMDDQPLFSQAFSQVVLTVSLLNGFLARVEKTIYVSQS